TDASVSVGELDVKSSGALNDDLSGLGRDGVGDLSAIPLVVHEEHVEVLLCMAFKLTADDYEKYKGVMFRCLLDRDKVNSGSKQDEERLIKQKQFINSYFARFIRSGGLMEDHLDLTRIERDQFGIPQDLSRRYLVVSQRDFVDNLAEMNHVPRWLVRHFEYAVQLSADFANELKLKKIIELRRTQRDLPIAVRREEILQLLEKNQVLIVAGDTGCGKSTQVPQYLLSAGYTGICCTQPRRIACTALAKRVSYETLNSYGSEVAYKIRFESTKTKRTKMLFLTEGLLLRQFASDPLLEMYNVIILDEVHERNLNSDLLVGLLRDLVSKRDDLKLILMSATINLELFTDYYKGAPVVKVPGRLFPIELKYRPIKQMISDGNKKTHKIDPEPFLRVLEVIDKEVPATERGDALIFLNGIAEMTTVAEALKTYAEYTKGWIILLLHSEFWVSKASANQRKGRAGRTGPGICYRLYSEDQFEGMDDFTLSEINRVSLKEMVLQMINLNLALDPLTFPYIERPEEEALQEAIATLKFQGVLYPDRDNHRLTALGETIAKLPVEVPIAKMLVYGCVLGQEEVMLTIAAGLSIQFPFTNRSYREAKIVEKRAPLTSPLGDPFTLIEVFREWLMQKAHGYAVRRWTLDNGIDEHRLYEISKLRLQYRQILQDAGLVEKREEVEESRQRRIDLGEKKKLFDMKRNARFSEKAKNVLRVDRHYDSILEEKEEEELEKEKDPLKADVRTVEFLLAHKQSEVEMIRKTHRLSRKDTEAIRTVIAASLYPAYALLDPANRYKQGQELFVHTRAKPFSLIHPNSSIAQYHSESLDSMADGTNGMSALHQIPVFGLLLETTKPYIVNVMPVPALYALVFAKKVIADDWRMVTVDDVVEISFEEEDQAREVFSTVQKIRRELARGLARRLKGKDYEGRDLIRYIDRLARMIMEGGGRSIDNSLNCSTKADSHRNDMSIAEDVAYRRRRGVSPKTWRIAKDVAYNQCLRRLVDPPKRLEGVAFITPDGEVPEDVEVSSNEDEDEMNAEREQEAMVEAMAFDPMAPKSREQLEQEEEERRREEKKREKPKESYYQILLRKKREMDGRGVEGGGDEEPKMKKEKTEDGDGTETRQKRRDPMAGLEERQVKEEIEDVKVHRKLRYSAITVESFDPDYGGLKGTVDRKEVRPIVNLEQIYKLSSSSDEVASSGVKLCGTVG
uniref:Helicase ATP-binding domain-containing protein n=1 Tax=Pristionchus pacificus TaxID=54126 RepID=A0A8R1UZB0_PRIPA